MWRRCNKNIEKKGADRLQSERMTGRIVGRYSPACQKTSNALGQVTISCDKRHRFLRLFQGFANDKGYGLRFFLRMITVEARKPCKGSFRNDLGPQMTPFLGGFGGA